jgi:hypothetical protein
MNLDQNLFKSDSRGNACAWQVVAMRKEKILTEVIKSNPLKLLVLLKENLLKSMVYNYRYKKTLKAKGEQ